MAVRGKAKVRFKEREELLDFLLEVSATTSETLDLERLMGSVADYVKEVIAHDLFAILLYTDKRKGLSIRYSRGHRDEVIRNLFIPLGEGITGLAAEKREPVMANDVRAHPSYLNALDAVRSELAVPMIARGKLVGVIDLQSTVENTFTEQDRSLLRLIAARVASSIDNARLYRRVERNNRTLRILAHLSNEFSAILDLDTLLGKIARTMRALISYDAFSIMLVDQERQLLRHRFSVRYDKRVTLDNLPLGEGVTGAAALSREPVRVADTMVDTRYVDSHPGIRSELAIPLIVQDKVVGVMDLESERINYFTDEHLRLLSLLAPQIASSVENARLYETLALREQRLEQDMKAARKLQSVLLPREPPPIEGLEAAIGFRPCNEVSGDLYDFFEYTEGRTLIAFGDVSGKGAAAALYGALVSGLLRTLAPHGWGPAKLMKVLNETLLERKVDAQYVTLLLLLWDPKAKRLRISNAGAVQPVICRSGGELPVKVAGVPLGLLDHREYEEIVVDAQPCDIIALYSDGIQDQTSGKNEEEYGARNFFPTLQKLAHKPPREIVDEIFRSVDQFRQDAAQMDDQTLLILKAIGPGSC